MSALTDAIARLESGGSSVNGPMGGYANYRYQQFGGFVSQYGFGEAGINNYASQVLQANPNATFGDLYGGYVTGTGNPSAASLNSLLTTTQPGAQGAYDNLMNNSPIAANTPLSSLMGGGNASSIWNDGTAAVPYSSNIDPLGAAGGGSGPAIGYFGQQDQFAGSTMMGGQFADPGSALNSPQSSAGGNYGYFGEGLNLGQSSGFGNSAVQQNQADIGSAMGGGGDGTLGDMGSGSMAGSGVDTGQLDAATSPQPGDMGVGVPGSSLFSGITGMFGGLFSGNSSSSGGQDFFAWLGDWAIRGAVILLGFIFVVAGLYMLKGNLVLTSAAPLAKAAAKAV